MGAMGVPSKGLARVASFQELFGEERGGGEVRVTTDVQWAVWGGENGDLGVILFEKSAL